MISHWQQSLQQAVRSIDELFDLLNIEKPLTIDLDPHFPLRVPREFIAKMRLQDLNDPLLRQILPLKEENMLVSGYTRDPVQDMMTNPQPGIIHKYPNKVLFMPTGACAVHCRFCFRRHFPYQENTPNQKQWADNIQYLRRDLNIREVILFPTLRPR